MAAVAARARLARALAVCLRRAILTPAYAGFSRAVGFVLGWFAGVPGVVFHMWQHSQCVVRLLDPCCMLEFAA